MRVLGSSCNKLVTLKMNITKATLLLIFVGASLSYSKETSSGVFEKIKAGFELAGRILGLDQTNNLAQMVSQTFSSKHTKTKHESENVFGGFLRLLGLDTKKLSAITVNAVIFVAQLISTTLSRRVPSQLEARKIKQGNPYEWVMNTPRISDILVNATDSNLPKQLVEYVKERSLDENSDCIQLLICKNAPFIWTMQKTLNSTNKVRGLETFFTHLPGLDEYAANGDDCEKKHPYCLIYY